MKFLLNLKKIFNAIEEKDLDKNKHSISKWFWMYFLLLIINFFLIFKLNLFYEISSVDFLVVPDESGSNTVIEITKDIEQEIKKARISHKETRIKKTLSTLKIVLYLFLISWITFFIKYLEDCKK